MFTGLGSDQKIDELLSTNVEWLFTLEKARECLAFTEANFARAKMHFIDGLDILEEGGTMRDLYQGYKRVRLSEEIKKHEVDILFVTTSCNPYANCRSGRKSKGTTSHDDARLNSVVHEVIEQIRPKAVLYEQVFGLVEPESKAESTSPCEKWTNELRAKFPSYDIKVFYISGQVFLVLCRHRVYAVLLDAEYGGTEGLEMLSIIVKAFRKV